MGKLTQISEPEVWLPADRSKVLFFALSLSSPKTKWILKQKQFSGRSLSQVMTPHSSRTQQQLAALFMTGTVVEAKRRRHSAGTRHPFTRAKLSEESHVGACWWGATRYRRTPWNWALGLVDVGHEQMRMTLKNSPSAHAGNSLTWYTSPFEWVIHTHHIQMLLFTHHLWRLTWEMNMHNDMTVPGFQMIKWAMSDLGLDVSSVPAQMGIWKAWWPNPHRLLWTLGGLSSWQCSFRHNVMVGKCIHQIPTGEGRGQALGALHTPSCHCLLAGLRQEEVDQAKGRWRQGDTGGQFLVLILFKGQNQKERVNSNLYNLVTTF